VNTGGKGCCALEQGDMAAPYLCTPVSRYKSTRLIANFVARLIGLWLVIASQAVIHDV